MDIFTHEPKDHCTIVTFTKNAIRGNHFHKESIQSAYVLEGNFKNLRSVDEDHADVFICRARFDRAHILPAVIGYGLIDVDAAGLHGLHHLQGQLPLLALLASTDRGAVGDAPGTFFSFHYGCGKVRFRCADLFFGRAGLWRQCRKVLGDDAQSQDCGGGYNCAGDGAFTGHYYFPGLEDYGRGAHGPPVFTKRAHSTDFEPPVEIIAGGAADF